MPFAAPARPCGVLSMCVGSGLAAPQRLAPAVRIRHAELCVSKTHSGKSGRFAWRGREPATPSASPSAWISEHNQPLLIKYPHERNAIAHTIFDHPKEQETKIGFGKRTRCKQKRFAVVQ